MDSWRPTPTRARWAATSMSRYARRSCRASSARPAAPDLGPVSTTPGHPEGGREALNRLAGEQVVQASHRADSPPQAYAAVLVDAVMVKVREGRSPTGPSTPRSWSVWLGTKTSRACGRAPAGRAPCSGWRCSPPEEPGHQGHVPDAGNPVGETDPGMRVFLRAAARHAYPGCYPARCAKGLITLDAVGYSPDRLRGSQGIPPVCQGRTYAHRESCEDPVGPS